MGLIGELQYGFNLLYRNRTKKIVQFLEPVSYNMEWIGI